jgi:hypothetical protein
MVRQSHSALSQCFLGFWGQIAGFYHRSEGLTLVGSVAKGCVRGMTAPAERDRRAASQPELLAFLIDDSEVAFHTQWAVRENCDFCASQGFLRLQNL